jgi:Holliday junction resolvase RusA-like endonuclease
MKITLLTLPPSGSVYSRLHFGAKARLRKRFGWTFRMEAQLCGFDSRPKEQIGKVRLGIKVFRAGRRYDPDNAVSGLKPLFDGMRDAGYLRNDSPVWLELKPWPEQVKCDADSERVEIEYTEIEHEKEK